MMLFEFVAQQRQRDRLLIRVSLRLRSSLFLDHKIPSIHIDKRKAKILSFWENRYRVKLLRRVRFVLWAWMPWQARCSSYWKNGPVPPTIIVGPPRRIGCRIVQFVQTGPICSPNQKDEILACRECQFNNSPRDGYQRDKPAPSSSSASFIRL